MAIPKEEFKSLLRRAETTEGKSRYYDEHFKHCDLIYSTGSPGQKAALTRMLRQRQDDRTADTGGMDI